MTLRDLIYITNYIGLIIICILAVGFIWRSKVHTIFRLFLIAVFNLCLAFAYASATLFGTLIGSSNNESIKVMNENINFNFGYVWEILGIAISNIAIFALVSIAVMITVSNFKSIAKVFRPEYIRKN